MGKQKFYVVWEGGTPGIYTSWTECQLQTKGYEGAKYKSFSTHEEAERAFHSSPYAYIGKNAVKTENKHKPSSEVLPAAHKRHLPDGPAVRNARIVPTN